ncbi:MAG: DUF885 family protein [Gemmatimonadales bacterium]
MRDPRPTRWPVFLLLVAALAAAPARPAGAQAGAAPSEAGRYVPDLPALLVSPPGSELRDLVARFDADRDVLLRRNDAGYSAERRAVLDDFYAAWQDRLDRLDLSRIGPEGRADWLLLRNQLEYERRLLSREAQRMQEYHGLLSFAETITGLQEARRRLEDTDPAARARTMAALADSVDALRRAVEAGARGDSGARTIRPTRIAAYRSAAMIGDLRQTLRSWFRFYDGYDPLFTWWVRAPYTRADTALATYAAALREKVVGIRPGDEEPIVGLPIGRPALLEDLRHEMIDYTPEELIGIALREFAWCRAEMLKAARDMGLGDDWRAALERTKADHVEPGAQPALVRDLAREAEAFLVQHDLVTVPPLAGDVWRMEMLSAEAQKANPFFLGGEVIRVAYPTEEMDEGDKLMTMRGNNRHFARATVFHELIPGHHLQGFMNARYNAHRGLFYTPFYIEGNAFYWETVFWDLGFPRSPEDRMGMLFWRMHRAARIIFSLNFHLGNWSPQRAIDFLVDSVGHERANATAEVRRSFNGDYSPLYQVAYMIGGIQFRALRHELVDSGRMTDRQFHDAVLREGPIPVELVRLLLTGQVPDRNWRPSWEFGGGAR